jgi:hypothetical protein
MTANLFDYKLPANLYRRFLIMTSAWDGTRANPASLMIKSHEGGDGLPFFWCGWPENIYHLYKAIGNERSIYCICGTFAVVEPTDENIRALATYYAAEIIKVQAQGPYLIGGFCEAALTSYEIAKILLEQGHDVGALFLIERDVIEYDLWLKIANFCFKVLGRLFDIRKAPISSIQEILSNRTKKSIAQFDKLKVKFGIGTKKVEVPQIGYKFTPYPRDVVFVFIRWGMFGYYQFSFLQNYWKKLVLGNVQFDIVDGFYHHDLKNWSAIAEIIRKRLLEAGF